MILCSPVELGCATGGIGFALRRATKPSIYVLPIELAEKWDRGWMNSMTIFLILSPQFIPSTLKSDEGNWYMTEKLEETKKMRPVYYILNNFHVLYNFHEEIYPYSKQNENSPQRPPICTIRSSKIKILSIYRKIN